MFALISGEKVVVFVYSNVGSRSPFGPLPPAVVGPKIHLVGQRKERKRRHDTLVGSENAMVRSRKADSMRGIGTLAGDTVMGFVNCTGYLVLLIRNK